MPVVGYEQLSDQCPQLQLVINYSEAMIGKCAERPEMLWRGRNRRSDAQVPKRRETDRRMRISARRYSDVPGGTAWPSDPNGARKACPTVSETEGTPKVAAEHKSMHQCAQTAQKSPKCSESPGEHLGAQRALDASGPGANQYPRTDHVSEAINGTSTGRIRWCTDQVPK